MRDEISAKPTYWMNVTTSANWKRSPVGIVRVEEEIRRHLFKKLQDRLQPVVFREDKFALLAPTSFGMAIETDDFWPEPSYGSATDVFDPSGSPAAALDVPLRTFNKSKGPRFSYGDIIITMGLDWDYPGLHDEVRRLAKIYNLTVITCCYDLIPILYPQFCVADVASWFKEYLIGMAWSSDGVLCISENTRRDYLHLASELGLPPRRTEVIRLGSSLPSQVEGARVAAEVDQILEGRFFLFVSTIERRKNHEVLYRAYHLIRQTQPSAELPKLVFVGMEGWGVSELMSDIRLDPLTKDDIVILTHVSDHELALLYARCDAFLYPSHYEGWGLPVAEALQLGRPVIASSAGSIPEVGGDLVRYLDPWSPHAWAEALLQIANGEADLESWSERIADFFVPYDWSSAADTVIAMATELRRAKPFIQIFEAGYHFSTVNGVHYGDKIIYHGRQGIICHGPYVELTVGRYEARVQVDWITTAPGIFRVIAAHNRGSSRIAVLEIETRLLGLGHHEVVLSMDLGHPVEDFELICETDCIGEIRMSVDRLEICRM